MKTFSYFLLCLFAFYAVYSCANKGIELEAAQVRSTECNRVLLDTEISQISIGHNDYVKQIFRSLDGVESPTQADIISAGTALKDEEVSQEDWNFILAHLEVDSWTEVPNPGNISAEAIKYVERCIDITHEGISHFDSYKSMLSVLENEAQDELSCLDLDFVFLTTAVARQSAYLWLPEDLGGQGYYSIVRDEYYSRLDCRDAVIAADLTGAASIFMAWGTGLAVPGANGVIAGAIALSSGIASASAAAANCP